MISWRKAREITSPATRRRISAGNMVARAKIGTSLAKICRTKRTPEAKVPSDEGGAPMTQPLGNCPGCGGDEPFEQIHPVGCPDADGGECPEWACTGCGAAVIMGTLPSAAAAAYPPVRAA
jgi:hypothetical protein